MNLKNSFLNNLSIYSFSALKIIQNTIYVVKNINIYHIKLFEHKDKLNIKIQIACYIYRFVVNR